MLQRKNMASTCSEDVPIRGNKCKTNAIISPQTLNLKVHLRSYKWHNIGVQFNVMLHTPCRKHYLIFFTCFQNIKKYASTY